MTQFGPMTSSQDGIDRLTLRVNFRVTRTEIVTIVAYSFPIGERLTKQAIFDAVILALRSVGQNGIQTMHSEFKDDWQARWQWADAQISRLFRGWD